MSTNHTSNYNLCQWEPDDKVLRTDFNADNLAIDTALKILNTSLSSKASSSALTSLQSTVNGKASQSELDALSARVTQLQNTVAQKQDAASAVKIMSGSYVGDGTYGEKTPKTLSFDQLPELLIVRGTKGLAEGLILLRGMETTMMNLSGSTSSGGLVTLTWNTAAKSVSWYATSAPTQFNTSGKEYRWFAIG